MTQVMTENHKIRTRTRASPSQMDFLIPLLIESKVEQINSIGTIVRVEVFDGNLEKQYSGLLIVSLARETSDSVYLTIIDGSTNSEVIERAENIKLTRWRKLIELDRQDQFIPIDEDGGLTLNAKEVVGIVKITTEQLKKMLLR